MSDISRVDQAVLQLRAQLQRLARERSQRASDPVKPERRALERLRQTRERQDGGDGEFRRKFVRALLTEEMGEAIANQPEFERISNEVWRMLDEEPETKVLMDQAIGRLR